MAHLDLGGLAVGLAFLLDLHGLLQGGDEFGVDLLQRVDFHHGTLVGLFRVHRTLVQGGRVTRQQLVGHIVGLVLQVEGLALVGQAQRDHHLALPHRNRGGDGGVDLVHDGLVRVLDDFDLRRGLQGNHADAVEVVESLGKTVELGLEVLQHLRLHGVATGGGLGLQRWQLVGVEVGERLLAGQYGHFQLAVLLGVLRVHRVVHGDVGHEFGLRGFETHYDFVDLRVDFLIAAAQLIHADGHLADDRNGAEAAEVSLVNGDQHGVQ